MELRGIGIIDVRQLFGMGAIKDVQAIDLVIKLEPWDDRAVYDRLGLESTQIEILGVEIPSLIIPVKPGRNLASIVEVAAMNNRNRKMGHNAALELTRRMDQHFAQQQAEGVD
jgi:HPr kinase/phosphorylase